MAALLRGGGILFLLILTQPTNSQLIDTSSISIKRFNDLIEGTQGGFQITPPSTVFGPKDDAFLETPWEKLGTSEWKLHTSYLLGHHVVPEVRIPVTDFPTSTGSRPVVTASNTTLTLSNGTYVNGIPIIHADLPATNGIVHVIPELLVPPTMQQSIYDALRDDEDRFSTLVELLEQASIVNFLQNQGPLTLLAPTNEAFLTAGEDFTTLLTQNPTFTQVFLFHHMVDSNIIAWQSELESILPTTLFSYPVEISTDALGVNDGIIYPETDRVLCENGIIYPISAALIPPSVANMVQNIHLLTQNDIDLQIFADALRNTTFLDDLDLNQANLNAPIPITLLAPRSEAFSEFESKYYQPEWKPHLQSLVRHHVLKGKYAMSELSNGLPVDTLAGFSVQASRSNGAYHFEETALVVFPDVYVYNATIQIIDEVLLPPTLTLSIMDQLRAAPNFSTLARLLELVLLDEELEFGEGPYTLFAPTNDALQDVDTSDPTKLQEILKYHILTTNYISTLKDDDPPDAFEMQTLLDLHITISQDDELLLVNDEVEIDANQENQLARNGVIHVIHSLLEIPEGLTWSPSSAPSIAPSEKPSRMPVTKSPTMEPTASNGVRGMLSSSLCIVMLLVMLVGCF